MKLFEHPDFEQAVIRAAEHFRPRGLREAIIEKDYFVTEALRIIEQAAGAKVIFKGGTSLSKGWNLIQRFSEDIDIFLDPTAFDPRPGQESDRPRAEEAPPGHRAAPGADIRRQGKPDHRRLRPQRPLRVCPAIRRRRRDPQPRVRRGRHRQRPGADRARPAPVLRRAVPPGKRGHARGRGRRPVRDAAAAFPRPSSRRCSPSTPRSRRSRSGDAPLRRVRVNQGRLRPNQPGAFRRATCRRPR